MRTLFLVLVFTTLVNAQSEPRKLPGNIVGAPATPATAATAGLPREELMTDIDLRGLRVQRLAQSLVITNRNQVFRECNPLSNEAEATVRLLKDLVAFRWGTLGQSRRVVEYGLTVGQNGEWKVPTTTGQPQSAMPLDLTTLRAEQIRGVWCVRDNAMIHANFGLEKLEAEQMVGVCKKYGFNRLGTVAGGAVCYLFVGQDELKAPPAVQNANLSRVGVEVPGLGFRGEKVLINPRSVELRAEKNVHMLRHGGDILASFGGDEWLARDGLRAIQEAKLNEFCRIGDLTFFLKDGKAPVGAPMLARVARFDPNSLRAVNQNGVWMLTDITGKAILPLSGEVDAKEAIAVIKAFGFDATAAVGHTPGRQVKWFIKSK